MSRKNCWLWHACVILTGASSGIGRDIAQLLIERYECRIIGIARNEQKLKEFRESLGERSGLFSYLIYDVSKQESWQAIAEWLDENDIVPDLLINNAGVLPPFRRTEKTEAADFERVMQINFFAQLYGVKTLMPRLKNSAHGGAIVNVASSAALAAIAGTAAYSASKSASRAFTEALREEEKGMYVALVCPGFTKTDIFREMGKSSSQSLIDVISMPCRKMSKKIVRRIARRRSRSVLGLDAWFMDIGYRLCPVLSLRLIRFVLKSAHLDIMTDVYE